MKSNVNKVIAMNQIKKINTSVDLREIPMKILMNKWILKLLAVMLLQIFFSNVFIISGISEGNK